MVALRDQAWLVASDCCDGSSVAMGHRSGAGAGADSCRSCGSPGALDLPHEQVDRPPSARSSVDTGAFLSRLDCPLLFAKHEGCLASTDEGFEEAAATFLEARLVSVTDAPLTSPEFAEALRPFCRDVVAAQ
jgi:hypothetical protein